MSDASPTHYELFVWTDHIAEPFRLVFFERDSANVAMELMQEAADNPASMECDWISDDYDQRIAYRWRSLIAMRVAPFKPDL